jgi:hypothetical protein
MFATLSGRLILRLATVLGVFVGVQAVVAPPTIGAQDQRKAFLPIVIRPVAAVISFGATVDSEGVPNPPVTQLPAGSRKLYYYIPIAGADGATYRREWTINGERETAIDRNGVIVGDSYIMSGVICYSSVPGCDSPTGTLPAGTFLLQLYIDNILVAQNTATVAAGQQNAAATSGMLQEASQP